MVVMALPLGVAAAIFLVEYAGKGFGPRIIRRPSTTWRASRRSSSASSGSVLHSLRRSEPRPRAADRPAVRAAGDVVAAATLAILVLPVVIVSTEEALRAVPLSHREAAFALGATPWQVVRRTVLPQAYPGILTGAILSVSRGAGETAPSCLPVARISCPTCR